ncbi:MAG: FAD-binding oxidoreductase [Deltaproteobacteria bacterium]|nr:FAD-binding oxidoreductase [Deltaproteobacteria bacterium]
MGRIYVPGAGENHRADTVVIGGGIVGTATAFWLSRAGLDVILVEMRDGLSTLTTTASVECFRAQFTEPAMAALARKSIEIFENFADVVGIPGYDISLHQQGYLFITDDPKMVDDLESAVEQYHKLGIADSEFLSGEEIRARFPFVSPAVVAGTFRQRDGWLSTHEVTQGFAKGCGASFFTETRATAIVLDDQGVCRVETTRGDIETRTVVDAAGPFAGQVARMVGIELPLEPVRRQRVFVTPSPLIPQDAPFTVDLVNGSYWRPEVGGALLAWVDPDEPVSEPSERLKVDWDFPAVALDKVMRLTPFWEEVAGGMKKRDIIVSAGQYVYTPDDQPLIGPVAEVPGFYVNCGYWAGVMLSPEAGKWVADLISGEMAQEDNPLRPSRFEEGTAGKGKSFLSGH